MTEAKKSLALGNTRQVSVFAPASVGNVGVGFDVLGHALQGVGDTVTVERSDEPGVRVASITGIVTALPSDPAKNTAAAAVMAMVEGLGLEAGCDIHIHKGIPLGSGLGGSAASAAAAVFAINQMLKIPVQLIDLYPYALQGEMAASGSEHGDNVAASLLGGLTLVGAAGYRRPVQIPVPNRLRCVVVHPAIEIETRDSREALPKTFKRQTVVDQMANLSAFIAGCFQRDIDLIGASLKDLLVERGRAKTIPGFAKAKKAALEAGALGCSISGSGPSVFAWFQSESAAATGGEAMARVFADEGFETQTISSPVGSPGARALTLPPPGSGS